MEYTPPIGLPKTLYVMLEQLLNHNSLNGWSIYQNKYKNLCLCIRFDNDSAIQSGSVSDLACSYRKQSSKQQQRNLQRVQAYNSKKRKIDSESNSPENIRMDLFKSPNTCIDTPVSLRRSTTHVEETTPVLRRSTTPSDHMTPVSVTSPLPDSVTPDRKIISTPHTLLEYASESYTGPIHNESITMLPDDIYLDYASVAIESVTESGVHEHHIVVTECASSHATSSYIHPSHSLQTCSIGTLAAGNQDDISPSSLAENLPPPSLPTNSSEKYDNFLCPNCDNVMTINHQCDNLNDSMLLTESHPNFSSNYTPSLTIPQNEPLPQPEPDPPDFLKQLSEDPNLEDKFNAICKTQ
jgi:hypothetical protein